MLIHHPEIVDPERAYFAIGAPWILPKHTGVTGLSLVQNLPTFLIGQTDKFARLINNYVGPAVGKTVGFSAGLLRPSTTPTTQPRETETTPNNEAGSDHNTSFEETLWPHIIEKIYAEGVRGIGTEAVMLMQKGKGMESGWSDWGDYDTGLKRLISALNGLDVEPSGGRKRRRLRIDVFYAEDDALIGPGGDVGDGKVKEKGRGSRWFDGCWEDACKLIASDHDEGGGGEDGSGLKVQYKATTVKGADHDGIWDMKLGVMEGVLRRIVGEEDEQEEEVQI